ncbi:hypothetical protein NE237_018451 [Protea cynaroides]|uniref:Upstream activation factor subunit spp27 n=1 Tax=Protea cynaroides TaxID=273540 RepID=A0A9Q0K9Y9_9MAGN|nr:hypothetical protein NE237_018451 [Protea cynaroides]
MVSDSELVERLHEFLRTSDLNTTTTAIVRRQLEEDFEIDLSDKKAFIREQVDLFLQSQLEKAEEEAQEEEEENAGADSERKRKIKSEENSGSDSEDEDDEEETSIGRGSAKGASSKPSKDVKKRGGFTKLCSLSPQLQKFVGVPELARTEVVKQIWAYIRENNLQDPNNKRNIICDEALRELFVVDSINMFQMNKALSKHIWPLESEDAQAKLTQKEKQRKQEKKEGRNDPRPKEKRQKGGNSGFLAPLQLSDALVKFIGTGESALSRADVVKKMWEYIRQNDLQDPSDRRMIICDEKLKELFELRLNFPEYSY